MSTPDPARGSVLVTGGAGYVGSVLVPHLLERGHRVEVLDCFLFGEAALAPVAEHPGLTIHRTDLRDHAAVDAILGRGGIDTVIQLAAMSNDPSSEIDPELTRAINLDAVAHLMEAAKKRGVRRFLYASSASVYGIKEEEEVTEDLTLEPITLYARYKAEGEAILGSLLDEDFCGVSVRAATVCGWSPRLRLDLTINLLTEHALTRGRIRVFGGAQMRPNLHILDLVDLYTLLIDAPREKIQGEAFNVSHSNASVLQLAEMVRREIDSALPIDVVPSDDQRSYRLTSDKVRERLGFVARNPLELAVRELRDAFQDRRVADSGEAIYRNVEWVKQRTDFRVGPLVEG